MTTMRRSDFSKIVGTNNKETNIDMLRRMVPQDVFLHHIVGPFLTPKECRLLVQRVWPKSAFGWKTHCCPIHTGTVFTYFREEEEEPTNVFDEDLEDTDDEGINIIAHYAATNAGKMPPPPPTHLTLRCKDCVMGEERCGNRKRCDHCNIFKHRNLVDTTCSRCPQIICNSCAQETHDGVCGECTLCAFCRSDRYDTFVALDVNNNNCVGEGCRTCNDIYCSSCCDVLKNDQDDLKRQFKSAKLAEARKKQRVVEGERRQRLLLLLELATFDASDSKKDDGSDGDQKPAATTTDIDKEDISLAEGGNDENTIAAFDRTNVTIDQNLDDKNNSRDEEGIRVGEVDNNNDDIDDKEIDPDVDANDTAIHKNLAGDDEKVLTVEGVRGNNEAEEESPYVDVDVDVDGADTVVIDQAALADASNNLNEGQDKAEAEAGERGDDVFVDEYDEEEDETVDIDVDYDELNLPNFNKELSHVQVCRSCHYCYCGKCSYQHQCHRCGCSYWL